MNGEQDSQISFLIRRFYAKINLIPYFPEWFTMDWQARLGHPCVVPEAGPALGADLAKPVDPEFLASKRKVHSAYWSSIESSVSAILNTRSWPRKL